MKRHLGSLGSINLVWGLIFLIFVDMKRGFGYKGGGGGGTGTYSTKCFMSSTNCLSIFLH